MKRRDHFENLGVDGRTILKWILKKQSDCVGWINLVLVWDLAGSTEHNNEFLD
jgi:hypothetical protein